MTWDEIVGHEGTLEPLRRALGEERLHHSLLFHGPEGVGKRRSAFALAAAIQCTEAPGTGCGQCAACRRVLQGYGQNQLGDDGEVSQWGLSFGFWLMKGFGNPDADTDKDGLEIGQLLRAQLFHYGRKNGEVSRANIGALRITKIDRYPLALKI